MKTVAIIQARATSTRLPGKALLPVAGYPSAVLAALRVSNRGVQTLAATSVDSTDDVLAEEFHRNGIPVFRGPLHDVLGRYYLAVADQPNDCTVVRLTGDNVVPDGLFVQELATAFEARGLEYLVVGSQKGRLPYGLGAEAFSVAALRKAHAGAATLNDREHVGPWISRNCKSGEYVPPLLGTADYSHLRCTMDDAEDYQRVLRLFEGIADPVHLGWYELMLKLASLPGEPSFRVPYKVCSNRVHSELTLGTAQLGLNYGVANRTGKPSKPDAVTIVRHGIAYGVNALDSARAYGDAEQVLGEALSGAWRSRAEVITKLSPLTSVPADADGTTVRAAVDDSVQQSCDALGTAHLSTLLLHRWSHYRCWGGCAWRRLLELRDSGKVGTLGVSLYRPAEALDALKDPAIQHLQIPVNVLDRRWKLSGADRAMADRRDVVVHARSVFLQGILVHPAKRWPITANNNARFLADQLQILAHEFSRESVADLCLAYVRAQPWITSLVVGCETLQQLEEILKLFRLHKLTVEQCDDLERALPDAPEALLDPSKWNLTDGQCASQQ